MTRKAIQLDVTFWVAVAALLLAVWAAVRIERFHKKHADLQHVVAEVRQQRWRWLDADRTTRQFIAEHTKEINCIRRTCGERNTRLRARLASVEKDGFPLVIRTTSGEKPEVRNVEEGRP